MPRDHQQWSKTFIKSTFNEFQDSHNNNGRADYAAQLGKPGSEEQLGNGWISLAMLQHKTFIKTSHVMRTFLTTAAAAAFQNLVITNGRA